MRAGVDVDVGRTARGSGASPGSAAMTVGSARNGASRRDRGELRRELAERQVLRPVPDQAERGDVPERGGAAVAEDDLVAVGQREQRGQAVADPLDQRRDRGLPVRGAEVADARTPASAASASGRTLDGPQPKRPSAGVTSGEDDGSHPAIGPFPGRLGRCDQRERCPDSARTVAARGNSPAARVARQTRVPGARVTGRGHSRSQPGGELDSETPRPVLTGGSPRSGTADQPPGPLLLEDVRAPAGGPGAGEHRR